MRFSNGKNTIAASFAAFLVTACAAENSSDTGGAEPAADASTAQPLSAESLEMAESAWLSVSEDGEVFTTYLDADGRYRDERGGELVYSGEWNQNADGELCFTPNVGEGDCWSHGAPGLDGVMRATNSSGRAIELKRVSYAPPSPQAQGASDAEAANDAPDEAADGRG